MPRLCLPVFCWCLCGHHCLGSTGWNWKRLGTDTKVTIRTDCAHGLSGWVAHCCAESMTALLRQKKETNIKTSLRNAPPKFDSSTLRSKHLQRIIFQPSFLKGKLQGCELSFFHDFPGRQTVCSFATNIDTQFHRANWPWSDEENLVDHMGVQFDHSWQVGW